MWTPFKSKFRCNVTVQVGFAAAVIQECIYFTGTVLNATNLVEGAVELVVVWVLSFGFSSLAGPLVTLNDAFGGSTLLCSSVFTLGTWSEARSITWWWDGTYLFHKFFTGSMTPHDGNHWDTWNTAYAPSPHSIYHLLSSPWRSQTFTNLPYRFFSWNYDLPQLGRISVSLFPI